MKMAASGSSLNLASAWSNFWSTISSPIGSLLPVVSGLGIALIAYEIIKHLRAKKKGQGDSKELILGVVFGAIMVAPNFVIPLILKILQPLIDIAVAIINKL